MNQTALPTETLFARATRDFFTHGGHVPLVIMILEAILAKPGYFLSIDPYLLLVAGVSQAFLMAWLGGRSRIQVILGNLSGPLFYSMLEAGFEGVGFFEQSHHQAYWGFALAFGLLQAMQTQKGALSGIFVMAENVVRSAVPVVMYALFEARSSGTPLSVSVFFEDSAHGFLAIVLLLLGVLLGFADINLRRSLATVRALTARLRQYSEWSLGRGILDRAIADESTLAMQRVSRAVLFMDIRGFTAWSEQQAPEAVVGLLNQYYRVAEETLGEGRTIKIKYTADEVMAVFAETAMAATDGSRMLAAAQRMLAESNLAAGAGLHHGPVVEGVLGGVGVKAYDFIGDTVNTAKRLCDAAKAGELLISREACRAAGLPGVMQREIIAKGKREPLQAMVVAV